MSASSHGLCRVKRETCEKSAIRSSKFGVRSSENLELRTSNLRVSPFPPVSLSYLAGVFFCCPLD